VCGQSLAEVADKVGLGPAGLGSLDSGNGFGDELMFLGFGQRRLLAVRA
jgi:hypothetical protein